MQGYVEGLAAHLQDQVSTLAGHMMQILELLEAIPRRSIMIASTWKTLFPSLHYVLPCVWMLASRYDVVASPEQTTLATEQNRVPFHLHKLNALGKHTSQLLFVLISLL